MGYRSCLTATVHESDLLQFIQLLNDTGLNECFTETEPMDSEGYTTYRAEELKWYDGYEDVDAINKLFNTSHYSYLLREGEGHYEDGDDNQYYSDNPDYQ